MRKRHLLIGLAVCALLHVASLRTRRIAPAHSNVPVAAEGSFQRDGQYPGEAFASAVGVRGWGSWSGSDANTGTFTMGPFPAPRILRFGIGGYPNNPGNSLHVERVGANRRLEITHHAVGERWHVVDFQLPPDWVGRPIQLVGTDNSVILGGWFSVTEPIRGGRGDGNNALLETLTAWAITGLLLGLVYLAAAQQLSRFPWSRGALPAGSDRQPDATGASRPYETPGLAPHWIPLGAGAIVAICGYAAFWAYFANALFGVVFSSTVIGLACAVHVLPSRWFGRLRSESKRDGHVTFDRGTVATQEVTTGLKLMAAVGLFHLAVLHLFPTSHDFYSLAGNRFREAMPIDNMLPHVLAERLFASAPLRDPIDEWLSSDRPPLQSGWQLLTWPASKVLKLDRRVASGTAAVWFQLLWVAAAYGLLRTFALPRARAAGWVAALGLAGFFLQNTTFTWPKLAAAAFACGAFALLFLPPAGSRPRANALWSAVFAALAWLAHGGVAFSFLPLIPALLWRGARGEWRTWIPGATVLLILVLPWMAYQKFYDPPATRLFKWHLAGQSEKDNRGTWETIKDAYAKLGWRQAWSNKVTNFHVQVMGDWRQLADVSAGAAVERRSQEFFNTGLALTWWPLLALLALVTTRRPVLTPLRGIAVLAGWLALTIVVWCLLMFGAYQSVIHHGSYALMIGLFVLFSVLLERAGRGWLAVTVGLQAITLGTTWVIGNPSIHGPATGLPFVIVAAAVLGWFVVRASICSRDRRPRTGFNEAGYSQAETSFGGSHPKSEPEAPTWTRFMDSFRAWWREPRLNFWVLAVLAAFLALRKPHALHTPQLWAEDGSIFLTQAELHGTEALTIPYMGYLHTLPRLIAWVARVFDPAWWPAFYNGISFAIWLAVLARLFTSRFDLPGKPWLALALVAVPHTGEVFFNVTNLQWLTAFVLIQQAIIAPPITQGQRLRDLAILFVVALTGPFGIAFLPLFAWRWWRNRSGDNALVFGVIVACAAVQAWFVVRTGPRFDFQSEPLRLWPNLIVLARRLVVWPALGRDLALGLPAGVIAGIGGVFFAALFSWVLRPHPLRRLRVPIVAAFLLITAAAVYRTRPDTWAADNLDYGDRYFYIPRVLLAWLLIWEFNAVPRAIANAARVFCLLVIVVHVRSYTVPAPKNYHWASHVDPIRRGVRAEIPTLPEGWTLEYLGRPKQRP